MTATPDPDAVGWRRIASALVLLAERRSDSSWLQGEYLALADLARAKAFDCESGRLNDDDEVRPWDLMTPRQIAPLLERSEQSITAACRDRLEGVGLAHRVGRRWLIHRAALEILR